MATARKDFLRKGEVQRASDKRYMYCYTDPFGRRKYIYANDLVTLREKEMRLTKDRLHTRRHKCLSHPTGPL